VTIIDVVVKIRSEISFNTYFPIYLTSIRDDGAVIRCEVESWTINFARFECFTRYTPAENQQSSALSDRPSRLRRAKCNRPFSGMTF